MFIGCNPSSGSELASIYYKSYVKVLANFNLILLVVPNVVERSYYYNDIYYE